MRDYSRELDDALALAADLFVSVMGHMLGGEYGPDWFEKELRPRMLKGDAPGVGSRYSAFVREHGEGFGPGQMDITVSAAVLLYDEKYADLTRAYGDRGVDALNALREARNDMAHAAELTSRERLALTAVLFGQTALAASAFGLARFDRDLDERIDDFAHRLTGGDGWVSQRPAQPYDRQMLQCAELVEKGRAPDAVRLCTELAGQEYVPAMLFLARLYCGGAVRPDYPRALKWLSRAEKAGSAEAGALRARLRELMGRLERAKRGDAGALFSVGRAFETGDLVEKNQQKAYEYYGRAIRAGSALAKSYVAGRCEERDLDAVHLMARLGDPEASRLLSSLSGDRQTGKKGRK